MRASQWVDLVDPLDARNRRACRRLRGARLVGQVFSKVENLSVKTAVLRLALGSERYLPYEERHCPRELLTLANAPDRLVAQFCGCYNRHYAINGFPLIVVVDQSYRKKA